MLPESPTESMLVMSLRNAPDGMAGHGLLNVDTDELAPKRPRISEAVIQELFTTSTGSSSVK